MPLVSYLSHTHLSLSLSQSHTQISPSLSPTSLSLSVSQSLTRTSLSSYPMSHSHIQTSLVSISHSLGWDEKDSSCFGNYCYIKTSLSLNLSQFLNLLLEGRRGFIFLPLASEIAATSIGIVFVLEMGFDEFLLQSDSKIAVNHLSFPLVTETTPKTPPRPHPKHQTTFFSIQSPRPPLFPLKIKNQKSLKSKIFVVLYLSCHSPVSPDINFDQGFLKISLSVFSSSSMSEAQRTLAMSSFGRGNGYVNGVVPIRNPAAVSEVDEFYHALGGKKPIHSNLIANNRMAAVKFIGSVRTWAYETFGTEKAILLVAMATQEDMRINAEHIRIADQFVEVPGGTNNNNYANVQLIVEMAEITHVDAVWPGWGHASENPELPDALIAKGIVFLGPPATSMAALGDKIGSSLIAQAAEVPTLPWSGSHVKFVT